MNVAYKVLPLVLFLAIAGFLGKGLTLDPSLVPSPLIDKPAPVFTASTLPTGAGEFNSESMAGQVWVLNVWASWCAPCVQEHPVIIEMTQQRDVPVVGLNYKDAPTDALIWLARLGDPFSHLVSDEAGDVGLDWGVYGVPETFVIDKQGKVRYKHVGPLAPQDLEEKMYPIIDQLLGEPA